MTVDEVKRLSFSDEVKMFSIAEQTYSTLQVQKVDIVQGEGEDALVTVTDVNGLLYVSEASKMEKI